LENAVQLHHLTASIVVPAATARAAPAASDGPSLTISNLAFRAASITVRRGACVTDNARAEGRSIA
jgi:hypothetical protein